MGRLAIDRGVRVGTPENPDLLLAGQQDPAGGFFVMKFIGSKFKKF